MKIIIIGAGNVGSHLYNALKGKADISLLSARNLKEIPMDADIYLLTVKDDAIADISSKLKNVSGIVAHTSGSTPIGILKQVGGSHGVFYPLQTFSKDVALVYSEIPVFIEGDSDETSQKLKDVARLFTDKIYDANSEIRETLHIAAVFGCNFANHLFAIADDLLAKRNIPFETMKPLIYKMVDKAFSVRHPADGQTGPAVRGDLKIINKHLQRLEDNQKMHDIYQMLSNSIMNK